MPAVLSSSRRVNREEVITQEAWGSRSMKVRILALLLCSALPLPNQAWAQNFSSNAPALAAPAFQRVDENGVDLITGRFNFTGPRLRAGAAPREADFALTWNGSMWSFPTPTIWQDEYFNLFVGIGASSDELKAGGGSNGWYAWNSTRGNSSKIECLVAINNYGPGDILFCSYAGHDGSGAQFQFSTYSSDPPDFLLPNGNVKSHIAEWCNAQGYCSSSTIEDGGKQNIKIDGWDIQFHGLYSTTATAKLLSAGIEVDSLTISTPTANESDRYDDSVLVPENTTQVMTERDGSKWYFTFSTENNLKNVRRPGSATDDLIIQYNSDHRVTSLTNASGTWQYAYSDISGDTKKTTVTKPDGSQYNVTYIRKKGNIRTHSNELNPPSVTTYNYDASNRLSEIIYPEQNRVVYEYDGRGNVKTVTNYPKTGTDLIVTRAEYSPDCPSNTNCNLPQAVIDGNQKRTEYSYYAGFLASETKPSPNGADARPQVRWTYAQIQARALDPSGALVTLNTRTLPIEKSECLTTENCAGTADEIKTIFDYGPVTGVNPAYLRGTTVVHNGQTRRTCYDYDALGNRIAEHAPRANLATCYSGATSGFAVNNAAATEGSPLAFTVTRTGSASTNLSVNYSITPGSATAGSDYNAVPGTLTFSPTDTTKTVSISTIDDAGMEGAETLTMTLSGPTGGAALIDAEGTGTINDNDGGGGTGCSGVSFRVNDDADEEGTPLVFTITKTGTASGNCSVSYATADGTAIAPGDYAAVSGTLTFASGETTKTVSVTTPTTLKSEADENMYLDLSSPTGGATITDSRGLGTIYNYVFDDGGCPLC
jgi:YD repeat-containing protein